MPQLSNATKEPRTLKNSRPPAKNRSAKESTSEYSALGYEVFNQRRTHYVQVPLSVSHQSAPPIRTGSALLDSFVRDRTIQASELQNLHLINIDSRSIAAREGAAASPEGAGQQTLPRRKIKRLVRKPEALTDRPPAPPRSERPATRSSSAAPNATARQQTPPSQPTKSQRKTQPPAPASSPQSESQQQNTPPSSAQAAPPPVGQKPANQEPVNQEPVNQQPASRQPVSQQQVNQRRTPAATAHTAPQPSFAPIVDYEKMARDSAASVGLIDLNDSLLFGGDRNDLTADDPSISPEEETEELGLLTYLSQQISDFTVDQLEGGFPQNTDPDVMHRPDPPKHKTVLDIANFSLGQLADIDDDELAEALDETREELSEVAESKADAEEPAKIYELSQQVEDLNQKIAELTQKLSQVSSSAS